MVQDHITRHNLLPEKGKVIVGVSGGADSICLLGCLHSLGYDVVIGHLDHQIRSESPEEAQFVKKIGRSYGVETVIAESNVREIAKNGFSLEEAARLARYRFFVDLASKVGTKKIATGHTADDQIETVLMHFIRGSGPSGLRGMLPATELENWAHLPQAQGFYLVRPLLELKRYQTEAYCKEIGIEPIYDQSNLDLKFLRNRIRHQLIPLLRDYNPGIENILLRMSKVMKSEVNLLEDLLDEKWDSIVSNVNEGSINFKYSAFEKLHQAFKRSFIRRAIKHLVPGTRDLGFEQIERALEFLEREEISGKAQILNGLEMFHVLDEVVIRREGERLNFHAFPQMEIKVVQDFQVPSSRPLAMGWRLTAERVEVDETNRQIIISSLDNRSAAMDIQSLEEPFSLRTPRPGDRFQPLGMDGSIKVSDFFINQKIPQPARQYWPILSDRDGIIWVVGLRISNRVRITSGTKGIFLFQVVSP